MSIINNITQKISQAGKSTVQKTRDMTDIAQLKKQINDIDKEIRDMFNILGQRYFELYRSYPIPELAENCNTIRELCKKHKELKTEIESIKASSYCSNCGTKISDDSAFCINCGHKLKED